MKGGELRRTDEMAVYTHLGGHKWGHHDLNTPGKSGRMRESLL